MRRLLALTLVLPALAGTACGGEGADGPLDEALGHLPADAPFVAALDTDVNGDQLGAAGRLLDRFPFGGQLREALRDQLRQGAPGGADFERDVEPLLGNPRVVGSTDARAFSRQAPGADDEFVGAIEVRDGDKLAELVDDGPARQVGERAGASLYREPDGDPFAVKDDALVVAGSRRVLEAALARRGEDDRLRREAFEQALDGLPRKALLRLAGDLEAIVRDDPDTRAARRVDWVRALRTLGLTVAAGGEGLVLDFDVRTDGAELGDADLPIAAGAASPDVVRWPGELSFGLRDPSQVVGFAESAARSVSPAGFAVYETAKRRLEQRLGVDVADGVVGQLTGDMALDVALDGGFGARAELRDPAAFGRTLARIADALPRLAEGAGAGSVTLSKPARGEQLYVLAQPDGDSVVFGVVDGALVVSNEPERARRLTSGSSTPVEGAAGALVMEADGRGLAGALLRRAAPQLGLGSTLGGALLTEPLGALRGWVKAGPDGLDGTVELEIR